MPQTRLLALREVLPQIAALLPEREGRPLTDGLSWALRHQGDALPAPADLIQQRVVGNADQARLFLGSVSMVRDTMDRDTDEQIARNPIRRSTPYHRPGAQMDR